MYTIKKDTLNSMWAVIDAHGDVYDMWDLKSCAQRAAEKLNERLPTEDLYHGESHETPYQHRKL